MSRLRPSLHADPCDALPAYVRGRLDADTYAPPRPGSADAQAAVRRAAAQLAEPTTTHPGGMTHRRDGSPRHPGRGPKGVARALTSHHTTHSTTHRPTT